MIGTAVVSVAGLILLTLFVPFGEIATAARKLDFQTLLLALTLYSSSYLFRTLRWKYFYRKVPFGEFFLLTSVNTFLNNLLPARAGELSIFVFLKKYDKSVKNTAKNFLKVRIFDALSLLKFLAFALLTLKVNLIVALLVSISIYPLAVFVGNLKFIPPKFRLKFEFIPLFLSLFAMGSKLLAVYLVVKSLNIDFYRFTVGFLGGEVSTVLPLHSFAGIGTYETSFSISLKFFLGEDFKEGFKLAFLSHSFLLLASTLLGILSFPFALKKFKSR